MDFLFHETIRNWQDWGRWFQSIPAFEPLAQYILKKEHLPTAPLTHLTPGTNAVFRAGAYVVKIFAPAESGFDSAWDRQTELFATQRANRLGIPAPKVLADGWVADKYRFGYMVTEFIDGRELPRAAAGMSPAEKIKAGRELRRITDTLNIPCSAFNETDVFNHENANRRWAHFSESFRAERLAYIAAHAYGPRVFVHGDLCGDNILVTPEGDLYLIDFADAVLAPAVYEHTVVAMETARLGVDFLRGYFGAYDPEDLAALCLDGLMLHAFGGGITEDCVGGPDEIHCLADLRRKLARMFHAIR